MRFAGPRGLKPGQKWLEWGFSRVFLDFEVA